MNDITTLEPEGLKLSPEALTVANIYLETNDIGSTANMLSIPREKVTSLLNKREVKKYIDTIFLEQGYLNRSKIAEAMTRIIEQKLEELEEAEISSSKDIADLLALSHKMRMDEIKVQQAAEKESNGFKGQQTNIQNNFSNEMGSNYSALLGKLAGGTEEK